MRALLATIEKVLDHDVSILILGESGSGKDHLAEAIHACGARRAGPFIRIDCASIPPELFESELFGYEKGAFTDAQSRKLGKLELAQGGTLYFDEVAALAPPLQAKLLRVLEERSFTRLGGNQTIALDVRIISSSARDLAELRRDLLYRINVVTLNVPPLRERADDLAMLATSFLARRKRAIHDDALRLLMSYPWPGNVRELRNAIDRAVLMEESDVITAASLPTLDGDMVDVAARARWTLEELESRYIRRILRETDDNYSRAAAILGINRKTLLEKRKKYGL
jgi:DNA-binding NtrC family response regulator